MSKAKVSKKTLTKSQMINAEEQQTVPTGKKALEQSLLYEKKIYDLEQLLDIAKSFCQNLDFSNLLESIVYICMAQMHVLGAEIFVRDFFANDKFVLETEKSEGKDKVSIPLCAPLVRKLTELEMPISFEELKDIIDEESLKTISVLNPTLVVPLILKNQLNGILILQERIAIDGVDNSYTEYEQNQIMNIASLAAVAINNASLLERSSVDMMTHLKLKYYFFSMLSEAMYNASMEKKVISVLMLDIDFFKKFNDTYGHECGAFVLIEVANIIRSSLRDTDIASRYGGEEFTVLLNDTNKEEAMLVAERIRSKIDEHDFVYEDQHLHVTISIGVAIYDKLDYNSHSPKEFINLADKGLYESKNNGRNKVTFYGNDK